MSGPDNFTAEADNMSMLVEYVRRRLRSVTEATGKRGCADVALCIDDADVADFDRLYAEQFETVGGAQ